MRPKAKKKGDKHRQEMLEAQSRFPIGSRVLLPIPNVQGTVERWHDCGLVEVKWDSGSVRRISTPKSLKMA